MVLQSARRNPQQNILLAANARPATRLVDRVRPRLWWKHMRHVQQGLLVGGRERERHNCRRAHPQLHSLWGWWVARSLGVWAC